MRDAILEILNEIRPEEDFEGCSDFITAGLLDSFDIVLLVTRLDESFNIRIPGTDVVPKNFANLEAIAMYLQNFGISDAV